MMVTVTEVLSQFNLILGQIKIIPSPESKVGKIFGRGRIIGFPDYNA